MRYELSQHLSQAVLYHVEVFTQGDSSATEFVERFKATLNQRVKPTTFGYIPAPPNVDIIKQVIGVNGYFFKMTTTLCGVDFIWHNRTTNTFYFWGPTTFSVVKAMNSIRWRIQKFYEMKFANVVAHNVVAHNVVVVAQANVDDDEDYSDMPELVSNDDEDYSDIPDLISCEELMKRMTVQEGQDEAHKDEDEAHKDEDEAHKDEDEAHEDEDEAHEDEAHEDEDTFGHVPRFEYVPAPGPLMRSCSMGREPDCERGAW
jgi:hypothetical protein